MTNSRQKGKVGEQKVLDLLVKHTGKPFKFTPGSGSGLVKGDITYSGCPFCIEIKNYAESPFDDKILVNKTSLIPIWWNKLKGECKGLKPLLFFRYNRSKIYVVTDTKPLEVEKYIDLPWLKCYIMLAEEWITKENIQWA